LRLRKGGSAGSARSKGYRRFGIPSLKLPTNHKN
jgi:hypothetical protein